MSESISRRTLAKGGVWAAPAVAVAGMAPAYAASPTGRLALRYHDTANTRCPSSTQNSGLGTMTVNLNNTGASFTLQSDLVINLTVQAISGTGIYGDGVFDRTDFGTPSTSWGTTTEVTALGTPNSVTFRWVIPAGTVVPAAPDSMDWALYMGAGRTTSYAIVPQIVSGDRIGSGSVMQPVQSSQTQGVTSTLGCTFYAI